MSDDTDDYDETYDFNTSNFKWGVIGVVLIMLLLIAGATYYNYTEKQRAVACANHNLGYDENDNGCKRL